MAADPERREQLRAALSKHRARKRHGKYPDELRSQAITYSVERRRAGASISDIATELGVQNATASTWSSLAIVGETASSAESDSGSTVSLVPLVVRPDMTATRQARLEVEFPDGTRLAASGLTGRDFVEAIDSLRRMR